MRPKGLLSVLPAFFVDRTPAVEAALSARLHGRAPDWATAAETDVAEELDYQAASDAPRTVWARAVGEEVTPWALGYADPLAVDRKHKRPFRSPLLDVA